MPTTRNRVYLAGPMFSMADKGQQADLATALKKEFGVHLPQTDGIEVASVMALLNDPLLHAGIMLEAPLAQRFVTWGTRAVVALDIYQAVEGCQCVVLNLDGRVPDEGSLVEATVAWYAGRPVVPFKTTPITELGVNSNPMVDAITRWLPPVSDVAQVPQAVRSALSAGREVNLGLVPPEIQQLCQLGRTVWEIRKRAPLAATAASQAQKLLAAAPSLTLIEPVPRLQSRAVIVVIGIIELSKLGLKDPKRNVIMKKLIKDMKQWSKTPGVRAAILKNPSTA